MRNFLEGRFFFPLFLRSKIMTSIALSFLVLFTWAMMICPGFGQEANGKLMDALNLMRGIDDLLNESNDSSQSSPVAKTEDTATASATSASGTSHLSLTGHSEASSSSISSSSTSPLSSLSSPISTSSKPSPTPAPTSTYTPPSRSKSESKWQPTSTSSFSPTLDPPNPTHNDSPPLSHKASTSHKIHTYVDVVTLYVDGVTSLSSRTTVVEETDNNDANSDTDRNNKDNTAEQENESSFGTTVYQINMYALVSCSSALLLTILL